MIKLYKADDGGHLHYWETWEVEGGQLVHWGLVGERGEDKVIKDGLFQKSAAAVEKEISAHRREGYKAFDEMDIQTVLIQYQVEGWGSGEDLTRRHAIEELMDEALGWTGLGHCDGGDIGSGTINVCCLVVDPYIAKQVILQALEEKGQAEGAAIALETEDDFEILHPEDFEGSFSYF